MSTLFYEYETLFFKVRKYSCPQYTVCNVHCCWYQIAEMSFVPQEEFNNTSVYMFHIHAYHCFEKYTCRYNVHWQSNVWAILLLCRWVFSHARNFIPLLMFQASISTHHISLVSCAVVMRASYCQGEN